MHFPHIGDEYYRFNTRYGRIDNGYPKPLSVWGFPTGVDRIEAAQQWINGRTYFFVNDVYYRYNDQELRVDETYPRPTGYWWFGCGDNNLEVQMGTTMTTGGSVMVSVPSKLAIVLTTVIALITHLV